MGDSTSQDENPTGDFIPETSKDAKSGRRTGRKWPLSNWTTIHYRFCSWDKRLLDNSAAELYTCDDLHNLIDCLPFASLLESVP
jgi:hypothetical protein